MKKIEKFQIIVGIIVGIIVSIATTYMGWSTYQLNRAAERNNSELRRIEQSLSESKFGFERIRDVYDRTEKYLSSDKQSPRRGRALVVLISSLPKSDLQSDLLSLMVTEAKTVAVAARAADTKVQIDNSQNEVGKIPNPDKNKFFGEAGFIFVDDGRVQVASEFGYRDSHGYIWKVPAGFISDGASIPRSMWSVVGSPFSGKYRLAAILHDYFSSEQTKSSDDVNRMFYEAML